MYYVEKWIDGQLFSRSTPDGDWTLVTNHEFIRKSVLYEAARIARNGCLVPPDGGSPTRAEVRMREEIAEAILAVA